MANSTTVDELITLFGFKMIKGSDRALKNVKASIFNIRRAALVAGTALAGLGVSLSVQNIAKSVDQQAKFAAGIGLSLENLQKLQFAAKKAGATTGELDSFLASLTRTFRSTRPGDFNRTLEQMNVRARNVTEAVAGLITAFSDPRLSPSRRQQFGGQLGASLNIVNFLARGQKKIAEDIQQGLAIGAVIPERLAATAAAFNSGALLKLKATTGGLAKVISSELTPAISAMLNGLEDWIVDNKELIASDIGSSLKAIGDSIVFIGKAMRGVNAAFKPFIAGISFVENLSESLAESAINAPILGSSLSKITRQINPFSNLVPDKDSFNRFNTNLANKRIPLSAAGAASNRTENNARQSVNNTFNINVSGGDSSQETARNVVKEIELSSVLHAAHPGFSRTKVG